MSHAEGEKKCLNDANESSECTTVPGLFQRNQFQGHCASHIAFSCLPSRAETAPSGRRARALRCHCELVVAGFTPAEIVWTLGNGLAMIRGTAILLNIEIYSGRKPNPQPPSPQRRVPCHPLLPNDFTEMRLSCRPGSSPCD